MKKKKLQWKEISPSLRTVSSFLTDCESEACGLGVYINRTERKYWLSQLRVLNVAIATINDSDAKKHGIRKCPSHVHMTPLKGRCTKGWRHVRDIAYPSRPSNALPIRVWGLRCEQVRVKTCRYSFWKKCGVAIIIHNYYVSLQADNGKRRKRKTKSWM